MANKEEHSGLTEDLHLYGKNKFYFTHSEKQEQAEQDLNNQIAAALQKLGIDPAQLSAEDFETLKVGVIEKELKARGCTDEYLEQLKATAQEEVKEKIEQHQQYVNSFHVVKGGQ